VAFTSSDASTVELRREARSLRVILPAIETTHDAAPAVVKVCMKEDLNILFGGEPGGVVNVV